MITIVFGKPGAGKTAFLVQDALRYMTFGDEARKVFADTVRKVNELNEKGGNFTLPRVVPVYSNFPITANPGSKVETRSLYIDGFHMGFENEYVPVLHLYPGAKVYLSEAQRYYNSRRSKDLPDWVSRFYEEHRHFGLNIMLDVQRPGLIDINIRELCGKFIEVLGMTHRTDRKGLIISSTYHIREFEDWKFVEQYMSGGRDAGLYTERKVRYEGCVFDAYQSFSYFNQFVPKEGKDFTQVFHVSGRTTAEDAEIARIMYAQIPPPGFYPGRAKPEKKEATTDA